MSSIKRFSLPDLGEGLTEGEILRWFVAPGDAVALNQPLVLVETAKAAVEIPSPYAGVVTEVFHQAGETVDVGAPIVAVDTEPAASEPAASEPAAAEPTTPDTTETGSSGAEGPDGSGGGAEEAAPGLIGGPAPGGRTSVLVGYGPRTAAAQRRPRRPAPSAPATTLEDPELTLLPSIPDPLHSAAKPVRHGGLEVGRAAERAAEAASAPVRAKPPVRRLARDLGLDLASVRGTGPDGTISRDDVERAARSARVVAPRPTPPEARPRQTAPAARPTQTAPEARPTHTAPAEPGVVEWDARRERRVPVRGVRKLTADAMVASAFTAPHVTEFLAVDVTRTMRAVRRLRKTPELAGVRVGPLLLVARALLLAVRRNPAINASWDADAEEIVEKEYVNLGIAAATPRGLVVPTVKEAGRLSLRELAEALDRLVALAKEGRTAPDDLRGGTVTITNVGVFGVDTGTPILNPGEAAILCVGQIRPRPWVHRGRVVPRDVVQLSLSFDHRVADGELGSRVLADVGRFLTDPGAAALAWS